MDKGIAKLWAGLVAIGTSFAIVFTLVTLVDSNGYGVIDVLVLASINGFIGGFLSYLACEKRGVNDMAAIKNGALANFFGFGVGTYVAVYELIVSDEYSQLKNRQS